MQSRSVHHNEYVWFFLYNMVTGITYTVKWYTGNPEMMQDIGTLLVCYYRPLIGSDIGLLNISDSDDFECPWRSFTYCKSFWNWICVRHVKRDAARRAGLPAKAELIVGLRLALHVESLSFVCIHYSKRAAVDSDKTFIEYDNLRSLLSCYSSRCSNSFLSKEASSLRPILADLFATWVEHDIIDMICIAI